MTARTLFWETVLRQIEGTGRLIESLIDQTPTGETRNKLTVVNIHLMTAAETMEKAITAAKEEDVI